MNFFLFLPEWQESNAYSNYFKFECDFFTTVTIFKALNTNAHR